MLLAQIENSVQGKSERFSHKKVFGVERVQSNTNKLPTSPATATPAAATPAAGWDAGKSRAVRIGGAWDEKRNYDNLTRIIGRLSRLGWGGPWRDEELATKQEVIMGRLVDAGGTGDQLTFDTLIRELEKSLGVSEWEERAFYLSREIMWKSSTN